MGRRLRMPRLTLMSAMREMTVKVSFGNGFTGGAGDADDALELLDGDAPAEKFAEDADGVFDDFVGARTGFGDGERESGVFVGERRFGSDADLIFSVGGI